MVFPGYTQRIEQFKTKAARELENYFGFQQISNHISREMFNLHYLGVQISQQYSFAPQIQEIVLTQPIKDSNRKWVLTIVDFVLFLGSKR